MVQHANEDPGHDTHAQDLARLNGELLADRERMFGGFMRVAAWNALLIFLVVAFLALTQT